jgi:methylenetetrahydrofolate dehydrogenase (NADP+) / methenyltetrahydrofolate cyclohydrolase
MTIRLAGKPVAEKIIESVSHTCKTSGITPGLAVIQVGDDPASSLYVKKKIEKTHSLGWYSEHITLPSNTQASEIKKTLDLLNKNAEIHGILVQLPLPAHLNSYHLLELMDPAKDVDGFHPNNMGKLLCGLEIIAPPCTPLGVMALLKHYNIKVAGKKVILLSRSNIVGKPMAAMLIEADATLIWTHINSQGVPALAKQADIIISATGKPNLIDQTYVTEESIVIDIGITKHQGKTVGDVKTSRVAGVVKALTPVPGGIGPMTIAMLMRNVASLALKKPIEV